MEGGCFCGAIRYRVTAPFLGTAACHCRKCQYGAGGGANYSALARRDAFELLRGEPTIHESTADSGAAVKCAFCGNCGSPLWSDTPNLPGRAIRIGGLDDRSDLGPRLHIWMEEAPAWHIIGEGEKTLPRGPAG